MAQNGNYDVIISARARAAVRSHISSRPPVSESPDRTWAIMSPREKDNWSSLAVVKEASYNTQ